jgi:transglutaminase-like putative cysteine protease
MGWEQQGNHGVVGTRAAGVLEEFEAMKIRVGCDLTYTCAAPTPMVLMLNVHPDRAADLLAPDLIRVAPHRPLSIYTDMFGNTCARLIAPAGDMRIMTDTIVHDSGLPDPVAADAQQHPIAELPNDALMFLMGSRYCETDRLSDFAWSLFGKTPGGWARVQAIVDFVHQHIKFDYLQARVTRSAADVVEERVGVCRDYAHLAVTLCRCMNIPARYCTGYLGDIGVPPDPAPMDYSAWFEVYLGGRWYTFDARHNEPRIGRIVIARGRDAADVAISTTFGWNQLKNFTVWTDEVTEADAMPARELMVA